MKIFLTGGSGDLGKVLTARLSKTDTVVRFDVRPPTDSLGQYIEGSILDRSKLSAHIADIDCIVHIAAWHGYHEFTKQKNINDFWDLNVTGTFNVFQAAFEANIKNMILISSESVAESQSMYGWTKVLSEQIAQRYHDLHGLNVLTLRPRAFIPYWNRNVYQSFLEWVRWYWKGAVHIDDVAQAVILGIRLLTTQTIQQHLILPVDGAYQYTADDLLNWDQAGIGASFKKYYEKYALIAKQFNLDIAYKPTIQNMTATKKWLGYRPTYSLMEALETLAQYGEAGPPV